MNQSIPGSTRREFLRQASLLGAALLTSRSGLFASSGFANRNAIGLQLFTLRDDLAKDVRATIAKVAQIGFQHVETFYGYSAPGGSPGFWGLDTAAFKALLQQHQLASYSGHYQLNDFLTRGNGKDEALKAQADVASGLGQNWFVVPVPPFQFIDKMGAADYEYMAGQLNKAGEHLRKQGLKVAYHNHFWEFRKYADGRSGYEILLKNTDPGLVHFEMDLCWAVKAGADPVDWFRRYPGRFPMWHVKDIDKAHAEKVTGGDWDQKPIMEILKSMRYAEVGTGVVDFRKIFSQADKAGLQHYFIEQDDIYLPDKYESIRQSLQYAKKNLVVK